MEQLNKVELVGIIGSVSISQLGDKQSAKFSVATNVTYSSPDGSPIIETTWMAVRCFEGENVVHLLKLQKGLPVRVTGRLRNSRYVSQNGEERYVTEVIARSVELLESGDAMESQRIL